MILVLLHVLVRNEYNIITGCIINRQYRWHQKSVGAGTTIGIDSFDTGKMDHPTGWDKLNAIWIGSGYNLALEVGSSLVEWIANANTFRIYLRRPLLLGKSLVPITMVKLLLIELKMQLVRTGHSKSQLLLPSICH